MINNASFNHLNPGAEVKLDISGVVSDETMKKIVELVRRDYNNKWGNELPDLHDDIDVICQDCPGLTCIYWKDGTNTIVECQEDDEYKRELGIVWAIAEKAMGGKKNLHDLLKQYPEDELPEFIINEFGEDEFGSDVPIEAILGLILPGLFGKRGR